MLQRIFEGAERLHTLDDHVQPGKLNRRDFELGRHQGRPIDLASPERARDFLLPVLSVGGELVRRRDRPGRGPIACERGIDRAKNLRLQSSKACRSGLPARFSLGNRSLILIEDRQIERKVKIILVGPLIVGVAGSQVQIWKLPDDFELQSGLRGFIFRQKRLHIATIDERLSTQLPDCRPKLHRMLESIECERNPFQAAHRHSDRRRKLHPCLRLCIAHVTNTMGQAGQDFEKGDADGTADALFVLEAVIKKLATP